MSDGPIAATSHWATLAGTYTGSGYLTLPEDGGKLLTMRVADWYAVDDIGRLHENWLMVDVPDLFREMGIQLVPGSPG